MTEIAKIVQGNNFNVAIPLKVYILNDGEVVLQDYTPAEGDDVTIRLVGERRGYTYKPTTEGNVAHLQLSGHEVCDTYAVEVVIISTDGTMLRSYRGDQLDIVYNVDTIIADGAVEDGELYLDSQFFIQGEKGEQGDPGQDGTDGQDGADGRGIVSITKTATQGLVDTYTITYTDGTTSTFEVTNGKDGSGGGGEDFIVNVTYSGGAYTADKTPEECCLAFLDGKRVVFVNTASTPLYGDSRTFIATSVSVYNQYNQWNIYAVSGNGRGDAKVDILCYERQYTTSLTFKSITATTIIDNLTSTNTTAALSANQGRVLKGLVDGKANTADLAAVATSGNYNDLTNKPTIPAAQVNADWDAASGVAQILNKPTIPAAQVQSNWSESDTSSKAYIQNKPTIPTKTSDLANDSNFVDSAAMAAALSGKQDVTAIVSSNFPASFAPNVLYNFGTTDAVNFGNLAAGANDVVNLYLCTWTCQTDSCSVTLPQSVVIAGGESMEIKAGRTFEVTIRDNKLSYLYFD